MYYNNEFIEGVEEKYEMGGKNCNTLSHLGVTVSGAA